MSDYRLPRLPAPTVDERSPFKRYLALSLIHSLNVRMAVETAKYFGLPQSMSSDPNPFPRLRIWRWWP